MTSKKRMSATKSRLLAYLKHTRCFENQWRGFIDLPGSATLDRFEAQDPAAYQYYVSRCAKEGVDLRAAV